MILVLNQGHLVHVVLFRYVFYSVGGSFVPQFGTYNVDYVHTDDKLLFARDVVIENVLAHAFVEIVLAHRSEVFLPHGTYESHDNSFCNGLRLDISC